MERTTQKWIQKLHVQKLYNNKTNSFQSIIVRSDSELRNSNIERIDPVEFSRTCSIFFNSISRIFIYPQWFRLVELLVSFNLDGES